MWLPTLRVGSRADPETSQAFQELDEQLVDGAGPLLLGPVTAAFEDVAAAEPWHRLAESGDRRGAPNRRPVAVAADEQARHGDRPVGERGQVLPIPVDIAVTVQPPGQA